MSALDDAAPVMARAGHRCQCTGTCGRKHTDGGGRCEREGPWPPQAGRPVLVAAPAEPSPDGGTAAAARLPVAALRAWCLPCLTATERASNRTANQTAVAVAGQAALWAPNDEEVTR